MVKKLKILITLLLLSLATFSQNAISKDTCKVVLPCSTAKKVAIDLAKGDSALAELAATQEILRLTRKTVTFQQNVIDAYVVKEHHYEEIINLQLEKEKRYNEIVTGLEKDNRRLKIKTKVLGFSVGVTSLSAVVLYLTR